MGHNYLTPEQSRRFKGSKPNEELESRTELICATDVEKLLQTEYKATKPFTGFSFRIDHKNGGIFIWSQVGQRYYLIATKR